MYSCIKINEQFCGVYVYVLHDYIRIAKFDCLEFLEISCRGRMQELYIAVNDYWIKM